MKKLILITVFLGLASLHAQQDAMYTHYAFNTLAVNPAYAGSRDIITITGLHRSQWVGFEGAPITQTITFHTPVYREELGMGISLVNDKIGPVRFTSFYADLAYRTRLNENLRLSFGIKGGGNLMQGDLTSLKTTESGDGGLQNISSLFLPNVGAGIYLFSPTWYAGVSAPKLLENKFVENSTNTLDGERRHFFFIAGLVTDITSSVKLKPTMFIKTTPSAPVEADLTLMLILKDKIEIGLMGRTGDAVGALIGYNINNQTRIGYSFDWSFTAQTGITNIGSHEVMVRYDILNTNPNKIYSPRYF